jgi:hypothetical protein
METAWYLWAVDNDPATNEYLVQVIGEQNPEELHKDKLCADGARRNLFRCPAGYANVRSALTAMSRFNLKIDVFQESVGGSVARYDLWKASARRAARESNLLNSVRRSR